MKRQMSVVSLLVATVVGLGLVASAGADNRAKRQEVVRARLLGLSEVPSQSVQGEGSFRAVIDEDAGMITWSLSYKGLTPTQSHLHLGQHHTNGGIVVFLCTNLGNGPVGTQACPPGPAEISGTILAAQVVALPAQQVTAGDLAEVLTAIRNGSVYVNMHTTAAPAGEIRGQVF